jgi:alpha-ketoglutarate-dependent taurine dioxygenase
MFAEGELRWHSNESGNLLFAPAVSLLGQSGVVGSATGFLTTTDWYEEQSESFRSELDEMTIVHKFTPGRINPGLRVEQDDIMYRNMCPEPIELPLVIQSPIGIKGLHYSVNTINSIKGMSLEDSQKMFEHINKTLFVEKYTYDHWYQNDNDLCLFDNSITLHRRLGGVENRLAQRIQYDYNHIQQDNYNPYIQKEFQDVYKKQMRDYFITMGRSNELSFKDRVLSKLGF